MTVYLCGRHVHPQTDARAPRDPDRCYMCRLEYAMRDIMPKQPSYRYWSLGQWRYCWSTERMDDGKFAAFIYRPVGPGARTGKAKSWKLVKEVHFAKRVTARKHAEQWYDTAKRRQQKVAA